MAKILEIWLDIVGFEGYYKISDQGRVKSLARYVTHGNTTTFQHERILSPWSGTTSLYDCVGLYRNGTRTKCTVHRLVAQHFLPDWDPKLEVHHIDGNRYNNAASNLAMKTHQEVVRQAIMLELKNDYGEKSTNAKLTNAQAAEIRISYRTKTLSQEALAQKFSVCPQTISSIVRYKKYIR